MTHSLRRAVLFANPKSGRGRKWIFQVADRSERYGIQLISTHFDLTSRGIAAALERAKDEGVEIVLAAGGDGTQGAVSGAIAHTDFTLGVLPAGTANDFARSLQIPLDCDDALSVIQDGWVARVDLGQLGEGLFCHVATIGTNTQFAETAQYLRRFLGRGSYPVAALLVYFRREKFRLLVRVDGEQSETHPFQVAFVNAPVYGGPLELEVSESDIDDRRLQMVAVTDMRLRTVVRALPSLLRRRPLRLPTVESESLRSAHIATEPVLPYTLDGEPAGHTPAEIKVLPSALRVFVPASFRNDGRGMAV